MLDLFNPPTPPAPKNARVVSFEIDEDRRPTPQPPRKYFTEEQRREAKRLKDREHGARYRAKQREKRLACVKQTTT